MSVWATIALSNNFNLKQIRSAFIGFRFFTCTLLVIMALSSCKSPKQPVAAAQQKPAVQKSKSSLSEKERLEFDRMFFEGNKEKILGNYDMAEGLFIQALRVDPTSAATMYELGNIYAFKSNKKEALLFSKKAAQSDPKNIWYQLLYADCLKENKQYPEMAGVYERVS